MIKQSMVLFKIAFGILLATQCAFAADDDPASVAALQQLGAKIKRDKNNNVAEVNFRDVEVANDDLQWLSGLPNIRGVLLTERNIDDDGLAMLGRLATLQNPRFAGLSD